MVTAWIVFVDTTDKKYCCDCVNENKTSLQNGEIQLDSNRISSYQTTCSLDIFSSWDFIVKTFMEIIKMEDKDKEKSDFQVH